MPPDETKEKGNNQLGFNLTIVSRPSPDDPDKIVSLPFEEYEITRDPRKGEIIPSLKVDETNILDFIKFVGLKQTARKFRGWVRQKSMGWVDAAKAIATDKDGNVDEEKFKAEWLSSAQSFSARGETIADLESEKLTLLDELLELQDTPEGYKRGNEIKAEMKALNIQINSRKKPRTDKAETTTASVAA